MKENRASMIAICLAAVLAVSPAVVLHKGLRRSVAKP
jgi:hypothetical protein